MTKFKASRDLPAFAREIQSLDYQELADHILKKRNKEVGTTSIKMWFHRHPTIKAQLQKEISGEQVEELEVTEKLFQNGTFEKIPRIDVWNRKMIRNDIQNRKSFISGFKNICRGRFQKWSMPNWTPQHPERITQEDILKIVDYTKTHDVQGNETTKFEETIENAHIRLCARNFFIANDLPHSQISGAKSKGFGKYAKLHFPREKLEQVLNYIKIRDIEIYTVVLFMFKTATRITATLNALLQDIEIIVMDGTEQTFIKIYDKAVRSKHPRGKEWTKFLSQDLYFSILKILGNRKSGEIFTVDYEAVTKLNKEALKNCLPELWELYPKYRMVNHFWRHMFAQIMLRLTGWNLQAVGELGGWTPQALEESYGKPPLDQVRKWGLNIIPKM